MPPTLTHHARRGAFVASLLAAIVLTSGCTTSSVALSASVPETEPDIQTPSPPRDELIPVVRYGRYTLVEMVPDAAQRDLLQQVIDVAIPTTASVTVGNALRYVLLRSGYQLCEGNSDSNVLYALPLPAAHLHLGPLTLRDALLTLAGPAWDLSVDDTVRQVCFRRHVEPSSLPTATPSSTRLPDSPTVDGAAKPSVIVAPELQP